MKNKILMIAALVISFNMVSIPLFAEEKAESKIEAKSKAKIKTKTIVLASGRVLENAYIISRTPAGLNVGHDSGVLFIPFEEMSEERQKKYNYDPEKAKKYIAHRKEAQQRRALRIAKQKKAEAAKNEEDSSDYDLNDSNEFPQLSPLQQLQNELNSLLREKARLERLRSKVSNSSVTPSGGPSYVSYRGGKVSVKSGSSYSDMQTQNRLDKRRRLKEIDGELQRNKRRTTTVRNLIRRAKTKGIKIGKTI